MKTLIKSIFILLICQYTLCLHFDINSEHNRCYMEELFKGSVAVIKYKLWSTPSNIDKIKTITNNIHIVVYSEQNEILQMESIKGLKDKFSFNSRENAQYKICVEKTNIYWGDREPIYVQLKIMSDNMDEPNISQALKNQDLDPVKIMVAKTIKNGEKLIKKQEDELELEDNAARRQIEYISYYYSLAILQIIVVIIVGLYQIFSFRKFVLGYENEKSINY